MNSSYHYITPRAAALGVSPHIPHAHVRPASRSLGHSPATSGLSIQGPGGIVCRFLRHTRGRSRARGTPTPLGLRSDLGPCSGAALKAPDPKAGQPGTHTTAVCSNHSNQRRSLIRLRDNHRFLIFIIFSARIFRISPRVCASLTHRAPPGPSRAAAASAAPTEPNPRGIKSARDRSTPVSDRPRHRVSPPVLP